MVAPHSTTLLYIPHTLEMDMCAIWALHHHHHQQYQCSSSSYSSGLRSILGPVGKATNERSMQTPRCPTSSNKVEHLGAIPIPDKRRTSPGILDCDYRVRRVRKTLVGVGILGLPESTYYVKAPRHLIHIWFPVPTTAGHRSTSGFVFLVVIIIIITIIIIIVSNNSSSSSNSKINHRYHAACSSRVCHWVIRSGRRGRGEERIEKERDPFLGVVLSSFSSLSIVIIIVLISPRCCF